MHQSEKLYQWMKNPFLMMGYFILLVLLFEFVDKPVALYCHQLALRTHFPMLYIFDLLGRGKIYLLLFVLLGLLFRYVWKNETYEKRAWYLLILVFIPYVLNFILKITFGRARPELLFFHQEYGFYWFQFKNLYWSFPSGHTTMVISLSWAIAFLFPRYFIPCLILSFLVISSRVALCNHYLSDVLGAFYITVLVVGALEGMSFN